MASPEIPDDDATAPLAALAVAMTAMNSMRTIEASIESVRTLASRVLVIDSGSTDGTVERCRALGAEIEHRPWAGHVAQKQYAIDRCRGLLPPEGWILLLDSDEAVDPRLALAIRNAIWLALGGAERPIGYEMNRRLVFGGRRLRHSFQPEWRLRLFRSGCGHVAGTAPHDCIRLVGAGGANATVGRLEGDLLHDSWADVNDMLHRQVGYASITAANGDPFALRGGGLVDVLVRPGAAFLKQFVLRSGWRDGWRGMAVAGGAAAATLMKHIAIAERRGHASDERNTRSSR